MGFDREEWGVPPLAAVWNITTQDLWPLFLVPVALGLALVGTRRTTPPLQGTRRTLLVGLRTLAYTLLLLVLASPILNRQRDLQQRPRIAVLVDDSASMSSTDAPSGPTRSARARDVVRAVREALGDDPVDLEVVPFAGEPGSPLAAEAYLAATDSATGAGTDVLRALRSTADRSSGDNLQAIVLVSDGRATRGALDPAATAALGTPVFAIGIGDTLPARDLALGRVDANPIAYVESETEVVVRVDASGYRGRGTTLRMLREGREIFSERLAFDQDRGRTTVRIPLELRTPGRERLQLVLDPLDGERTERNNRREIRIEVLKSRIRVLVLAPRPDWDVAFLARTLRDDPNVQVEIAYRNAENAWTTSDGRSFAVPRGDAWVRDHDVLAVAGPMRELDATATRELLAAVAAGKGLLVLSTREGLPASEAWDAALPVSRGRQRGPRFATFPLRLTPQGRTHPVTAGFVDIAALDGALATLPPLLGRLDVAPKPAGLVLLAVDDDPPAPFLVAGRHGDGQTAVLAGFPFWRWGLTDRDPQRHAATAFVGALVRWLVQPRDVEPVHLSVPKTVFESGEAVDFSAQVLDAQFAPLDDAEVQIEVRRLDPGGGTEATLLLQRRTGRAGEYTGALPGLGPGEYEAVAVATRDGREVGRASVRITVDAYSTEFADTRQDVDFLREIADRTGGTYAAPEAAAALASRLPRTPRLVPLRSEIEIWNTTPLFLLFVGALGCEWLLRKRYGLL